MSNKSWYNSVSIKIGFFIGLVIFVFSSVAIHREIVKKNQIQAEINKLKMEADTINKKNSDIQDKIAYFQSKDYMEIEAKDKLNLKSPDEQVVIVKPTIVAKEAPVSAPVQLESPEMSEKIANHLKWWNYFFKY
jgi:cell division protein FtsB